MDLRSHHWDGFCPLQLWSSTTAWCWRHGPQHAVDGYCERKNVAWCQHCQPHSLWDRDTEACERCLWTPMLHSGDPWLWVPPRPGPMELDEGWLLPHHSWLMLPWAPQGRCSGASPMTDFCHQWDVTGGLGPTSTFCPPCGLFALALPGFGHWLHPQAAVLLQRHGGGQRGISQGISHAGTSSFSPLPLIMSPSNLSPCLLPALTTCFPYHRALLQLCHLSAVSPSLSLLPSHLFLSAQPFSGTTCTRFLLLGHWW